MSLENLGLERVGVGSHEFRDIICFPAFNRINDFFKFGDSSRQVSTRPA
ncbi:hypothetical protein GFPCMMHI_06631 [Ensifer adhaerens]|nr:hypothetical protein [Ensifer adhaerens]